MSYVAIILLVAAAVLVGAMEWPRLRGGVRLPAPRVAAHRPRRRRRSDRPTLTVVPSESEEFARAVERDLEALPTISERDLKQR